MPLIAISPNGPDNLDVRLSRTGAVDLPTAVGSRGPLTAAEGSGITVAIAQALAALHSVGLVHGGVRPTDVLLRTDGSAMLRPRVTLPDHSDDPVDVTSLATLVESVLGFPGPSLNSESDEALRAVLARARAEDPRDRPEPGTLAALAHDAVKPEPVRLPHGSALGSAALSGRSPSRATCRSARTRRRPGARRPRPYRFDRGGGRQVLGGDGAAPGDQPHGPPRRDDAAGREGRSVATQGVRVRDGLIAAGLLAGITVGVTALPEVFGGEEPAVAAPSPKASAPTWGGISPIANAKDPAGAAVELTERRLALLAGAVHDISAVNVEGSPAYLADQQVLDELKQNRAQVVGASAEVQSTELVTVGPGAASDLHSATTTSRSSTSDTAATEGEQPAGKVLIEAVVRIQYTITAHMQVSDSGETAVPASQESADLTLVWTPGGWRVSEVR